MGEFGVIQFIILPLIAMQFYGGGTPWNHLAEGYTFWQNFFSDLGRTISYNGNDNFIASSLFNISLGVFGLGLVVMYSSAKYLFSGAHGQFISFVGMLSGIGMVIIASAPDNLLPEIHMIGVWIWAFSLMILALFIFLHDLKSGYTSTSFFVLSGILIVAVGYHIFQGLIGMSGPILPATQKIVVYLDCVWQFAIGKRITELT